MSRNRFQTYRCGGYSSYSGHCGAEDCETCHPGGAAEMRRQEALEELEPQIAPLREELAKVQAEMVAAGDDASDELIDRETELIEAIEDLESSVGDGESDYEPDYEPDYEDRDYDY